MANNYQKFFFDKYDFQREADEELERRKNKKPPEPTFSLADMEAARKAAFEDGRETGLQSAKDSIEQKTELLVQSAIENFKTVEIAEMARQQAYIDNAIRMSFKGLSTLLPAILETEKESLIQTALHDFFVEHTPKTQLTLFVHSTMTDPVTKYAQMLNPSLSVKPDDALSETQARIEWVDGTFDFDPDALMERILQTLKGKVETDGEPVLDETAKTPHNEGEDHQSLSDDQPDQTQQDS